MKRIVTLVLIAVMIFVLSMPAFAEGKKETWDKMGFTLTYPEKFVNTKGIFMPNPYPVEKDGIYTMMFNYYAFSKAESDAFNEKTKTGGLSAEDTARIMDAMGTLLVVIGIDGDRSLADLMEVMGFEGAQEAAVAVGGIGPAPRVGGERVATACRPFPLGFGGQTEFLLKSVFLAG